MMLPDAHTRALDLIDARQFDAAAAALLPLADDSPAASHDLALCESMLPGAADDALARLQRMIGAGDSWSAIARLSHRYVTLAVEHAKAGPDPATRVQEVRGDGPEAPAVSVVMPTWNRADLIRESIESVQAQTFRNFELVIVNDGGDRRLEPVVDELRQQDDRIRYVYAAHGDAASALNVGVHLARASLVAYLDDDDVYYPDHLRQHVEFHTAHPDVPATFSRTRQVDYHATAGGGYRRGRTRVRYGAGIPADEFRRHMPIVNRAPVVHHRSLIDSVGWHREPLVTSEDWDFVLRIAQSVGFRGLDAVTVEYRVRHALERKGSRSMIQHRRDWNTILWLNGAFPLTARTLTGRRGERLLATLSALIDAHELVIDLVELRKLFAGPAGEARMFYELGKSLRRCDQRGLARRAFSAAAVRQPWKAGWWWKSWRG